MNLEEKLDEYGALIDGKLREFFTDAVNTAKTYHPFVEEVYSGMEELVLRKGKRLASFSTFATYKGYANGVDDGILKACTAIELYRHCILIHDDLIDGDASRRGGKTFHRLFQESDARMGEGTALFAGNALYALALRCMLNSGFPREKLLEALLLLSEGYRHVNESQMLDLLFEYGEPSVDEWYAMASKRAASLFKTTILTGAVLGDAPETDLGTLREALTRMDYRLDTCGNTKESSMAVKEPPLLEAAMHIGFCFDITDDLIDTFADEEQYGRPPGGDITQGKKPLHIVCALKRASLSQREVLKTALGRKPLSYEILEAVRDVVRETGALDFARERSKLHAEKAKNAVARTRMSGEAKGLFYGFIDYVQKSLDWYR